MKEPRGAEQVYLADHVIRWVSCARHAGLKESSLCIILASARPTYIAAKPHFCGDNYLHTLQVQCLLIDESPAALVSRQICVGCVDADRLRFENAIWTFKAPLQSIDAFA
jgi:hypothetical protein